jgi:hypothetical protein
VVLCGSFGENARNQDRGREMKFETINNQLCRMVEPEPLTPDSPMPCVVRYIQDCSPMGRYMKRKYAMVINTVAIVSRIGTDGRAYSSDKIFVEEVEVLEIIGYPVEEGSAEWALWQMEQGKKVCHKSYTKKTTHCAINDESQVEIFTTPYSVANGGDVVCHADEWLDHRQYGCGVDERTGWHLYEPQPEPKESPIDPIERPLRNLILEAKEKGVNIRTWYQGLIFTPESLTSYLGNGKYRWWNIGNWELTKRKANMPMPEPEPPREPEYVICKRCGGSQSVPKPAVSNTAYTTCSKCGGTGYEIKEQKPDNLYLNIKPSNPADWCFNKKNLLVLVDDNFEGIVGENVTREQVGEIAKLLEEK